MRCENGVGAACDAAAEGNELIQKLQERSRANRARNEEDVQERSTRNIGYDDYFNFMGLKAVPKEDGTSGFKLVPN